MAGRFLLRTAGGPTALRSLYDKCRVNIRIYIVYICVLYTYILFISIVYYICTITYIYIAVYRIDVYRAFHGLSSFCHVLLPLFQRLSSPFEAWHVARRQELGRGEGHAERGAQRPFGAELFGICMEMPSYKGISYIYIIYIYIYLLISNAYTYDT